MTEDIQDKQINNLISHLNSKEKNSVFNNFFSNYIKENPIKGLSDLGKSDEQPAFQNLKVNVIIKFLQESQEGKQIVSNWQTDYKVTDVVLKKLKSKYDCNRYFQTVKLSSDNIQVAVKSFSDFEKSADSYWGYIQAGYFTNSLKVLFTGGDIKQNIIDPIIMEKCILKFSYKSETKTKISSSFYANQIKEIMKYTDLEKEVAPENKTVDAIYNNLKLILCNKEVPDQFIKFTFKLTNFDGFKKPKEESEEQRNNRHNLIYRTIYILVKNNSANNWNNKLKNVFENNLYKEFIDAIKNDPEIDTILSFERMNQFKYSGENIKKKLEKEHLRFVVENGENGNKKINVVVEENYIDQKQKLESVNKIKTPNIVEIKSINQGNKCVKKWVLKIFFIPKKNKNKWILFGVDAVLFLIILSAFVMPYFIAALAFLHSVFVLTLGIICGLLSLAYGIILLKSVYFENENNGKIHIKGNEGRLISKPITENNKGKILHLKLTKKNCLNLNK